MYTKDKSLLIVQRIKNSFFNFDKKNIYFKKGIFQVIHNIYNRIK